MPWLESSGSRYWRASPSILRSTSGTPSSPKSRARDERFRNPQSAIRNHMKFLCVECDRQMAFEERLAPVPGFGRGMVKRFYADYGRQRSIAEITPAVMDTARGELGLEGM